MAEHATVAADSLRAAESLTPAIVLDWIVGSTEPIWFPSLHAQKNNIPRELLDDPLSRLRAAGLVRIADWVKGFGQGYTTTPEGAKLSRDPHSLLAFLEKPQSQIPDAEPVRPTAFDRGEEVRQSLLSPEPPIIAQALVFACVIWFLVGLVMAVVQGRSGNAYLANGDAHLLHRLGAVSGTDLLNSEWWRLLTCCFVHIGLIHLLLNMYALATLGSLSESIWGRRRFILLYLASGFGGSCLAMGFKPETMVAGASGAFWGLMTSLGAWLWINRIHLPPVLVKQSLEKLGVLLVINSLVSFMPGISWAGHFGGGLTGLVVAAIFAYGWRFGSRGRWVALALTSLLILGLWLWLRWYMQNGSRWLPIRALQAFSQHVRSWAEVQKVMQSIDLPHVERLVQDVNIASATQVVRKNLREDIEKLKVNAMAIRAENLPFDERSKKLVQDYTTQLVSFTDTMMSQLQNPNADTDKFKQEWASLRKLAATIPTSPR